MLAEQLKTNLLAILQRRDQWRTAAVINLQPRAANLPEIPNAVLRFSQTGSGLKLQLDLAISRERSWNTVEREIVRVILLEMIYRSQIGIRSGEAYVEPPDWLMEGLLALTLNRDRTLLVSALAAVKQVKPLGEFLGERTELLDPVGRSLYRAYSLALVKMLGENPTRFSRYIDTLAFASSDPTADLEKSFPELARDNLGKIWKSKISRMKTSGDNELLTFSQTAERLNKLLQRQFPATTFRGKSFSFEALCQKEANQVQKLALKKISEELLLLAAHANPVLRPIIQDYEQLATQLIFGKNRGIAKKMSDLKSLRAKLSARMREVDDYMNWFEATQLQTSSGLFESLNTSTNSVAPRLRRRDAFSIYLDAMELEL